MSQEYLNSRRRVLGLDSLRFICAMWVAMHHGARPSIAGWLGLSRVARDWNAIAFDGVAAVIVFFVISGLCVHYPYARLEPCRLPAYFAQRYMRIDIPLLVVVAFETFAGDLVGDEVAAASRIVLWSLWWELTYYAVYPLLLIGSRRIGFVPMLIAAFGMAYAVIIDHWDFMLYFTYSHELAWITALPAWMLGCVIAQIIAAGRLPTMPGSVWWWRLAALVLSIPPKALVYASVSPVLIGNPVTLGLYSIFVFFWLMKEIAVFESHPPPPLLEWGGRWSYSIYLVHNSVVVAFMHIVRPMNALATWPFELAAILAVSYIFFCLVERPSHLLARFLGRYLAKQQGSGGTAKADVPA